MIRLLCPIRLRQVILCKEGVCSKIENGRRNKNSVQIYYKKQQNLPNNKTQQKLSATDIRAANYQFQYGGTNSVGKPYG